ncbi:uncharacterized protein LOC131836781 isoform X3 [Mustela lutreola]|uniref:uncharacterized protein LOC131836781 isoform X3 n=1 Tax=Mustela lutreola TaxID=9666 RepID=UPI002797C1AF|nr:uncharacterized protein LOC131836781 isoform X3 [Mustela lutreola]
MLISARLWLLTPAQGPTFVLASAWGSHLPLRTQAEVYVEPSPPWGASCLGRPAAPSRPKGCCLKSSRVSELSQFRSLSWQSHQLLGRARALPPGPVTKRPVWTQGQIRRQVSGHQGTGVVQQKPLVFIYCKTERHSGVSGWLGSEMCLDSHPQHPVTPTLKEQMTLTTMGLRRAMWKKADRQPETSAWETPSPLPPSSPQNVSKKQTILSDSRNLKAHLSQPLCDPDSYKTYFKHRFSVFLSHTCTRTANLLTRYLQRASYLEGDAGHQRESFVHSANICGVPPMGQSCPAGLFQVTETEREGWVLRRGERGSCWATLPPPCLRCIFGRLSAVSREGGGVGGGTERRGIQDTTASGPQACRGDLEEHVSAGSHVDKVGHIWSMSQAHRSG